MRPSEQSALLGIRLSTYADLENIVMAFARGDLNLLILLGSHGLGKSQIVRRAVASQACWLQGNTSPFGLYCQLWRNQNRTVVLDDVDGLYSNREGVRLLKCLTQTELQKSVSWHTDASLRLPDHSDKVAWPRRSSDGNDGGGGSIHASDFAGAAGSLAFDRRKALDLNRPAETNEAEVCQPTLDGTPCVRHKSSEMPRSRPAREVGLDRLEKPSAL